MSAKWEWLIAISTLIMLLSACGGDTMTPTPDPVPDPIPNPGPAVSHSLQISRHQSIALSNSEAQQITQQMNNVLRNSDGTADVRCNVFFDSAAPVTVFTQGNGIINTSSDFTRVINQPGDVKVVNLINWCDSQARFGIFLGCARGDSFAVVRTSPTLLEGVLWAHEFGHTQGLRHRPETSNTALMSPRISTGNRRVNANECASFLQN